MKGSKNFKRGFIKTIFIIIPIIIMIGVYFITESIYQHNLEQSYELLRNSRESEVRRLVSEVDNYMEYVNEDQLKPEERFVVKFAVTEMNRNPGVYCYLLDTNLELLSKYVDELNDRDLLLYKELKNKGFKDIIFNDKTNELDDNYFQTTLEDVEYDFYWQRVPTKNSEYYVLLGTTKSSVIPNESIATCKMFVAVLDLILTVSLYGNIYLSQNNIIKKKED